MADSKNASGDLLHRSQVRWIDTWVCQVHEVRALAGDVRPRVPAALRTAGGRIAMEPPGLQISTKSSPRLQVDRELRLPCRGMRAGMVEIKISIVAPELDERLQIPDAQLTIAQ